jgi:hypothetical protein
MITGFADQLAQASALHDNHLSLDHSDYGAIRDSPGETVALIKTMDDLDMGDYKADWTKSGKMFLDTHHNNALKSIAFRKSMAEHLGDRIQRGNSSFYYRAKTRAWFKNFLKEYRENTT